MSERVNRLLLALAVLLQLSSTVSTPVGLFGSHVNKETTNPSKWVLKIIRKYELYNKCSRGHIRIIGGYLDANGKANNTYAKLAAETYTFDSILRLRSNKYKHYLCFNRRGKLKVRAKGTSLRCKFRELHSANGLYTEYQSVANPSWFLGFNRKGKPMRGDKWRQGHRQRHKRRCFQFMKRNHERYLASRNGYGGWHHGRPSAPHRPRVYQPPGDFQQLLHRLPPHSTS